MKHLFFGGVHPADRKELTGRGIPAPAPIPAQVVIPLRQHIGAPAQLAVKPGDIVGRGQKIANPAPGALSVAIHASIAGTVLEADKDFVVIENK